MTAMTFPGMTWREGLQRYRALMSIRSPLASRRQIAGPLAIGAASMAIPTINFSLDDITFTPGMAKRAGSVFAAAPIVQGVKAANGVPDILSFPRGTLISGYAYTNFDPYQGDVVLWWTPEYSSSGIASGVHYILYASAAYHFEYDYDNARFSMTAGGQTMTVAKAIVAGTKYNLSFAWDTKNKLDGTNYGRFSVDDVHTFGLTTQPTASAPDATIYVGSNGTTGGNSGIIQGLCVLRRVCWDGTYGVNAGNGDELNLIYAAAAGKDPALIFGSWDNVVFVPTNSATGALTSGVGNAWSHPHGSELLTDAFCQTTYAGGGWSTAGTPSAGPADIASAANKIYAWGYQFTAGADGDGISQNKAGQTPGADFVLRCVAHSSTADAITVQVYDETNAALIKDFDFGGGSTVTAPGIALFSFELPTIARGAGANCVSFTVKIVGAAAAQVVYIHQCELLNNLLDNPSLDTGAVADPWIPYGWTQDEMVAGDCAKGVDVHSTGASLDLIAANIHTTRISAPSVLGKFVALSAWVKGSGEIVRDNFGYYREQRSLAGLFAVTSNDAAWKSYYAIGRNTSIGSGYIHIGRGSVLAKVDDLALVLLTDVSLTCTPASQANSLESGGIRVDGLDQCSQVTATLTAASGKLRFNWIPRHSAANAYKYKNGSDPRILYVSDGTANNVIDLHWSAANTVKLIVVYGGVSVNATWDATGAIVAGTTYLIEIWYSGGTVYVDVDSVNKITQAAGAFGAALTAIYYGSNGVPAAEVDAVYLAP